MGYINNNLLYSSFSILLISILLLGSPSSKVKPNIVGTYHLGKKNTPAFNMYKIQILRGHKYSYNYSQWVYGGEQITKTHGKWQLKGDSLILSPLYKTFRHSKRRIKKWNCTDEEKSKPQIFILNENRLVDTKYENRIFTKR